MYRTVTRKGDKGFNPDDVETDVPKDQEAQDGKTEKVEMAKILDQNTTKSDQVDIEKGAK